MIPRPKIIAAIQDALKRYPVVLLQGPRQCGKTTVARILHSSLGGAYFDLEDPETALKPEAAKQALEGLRGLIVLDEIQRQPGLYALLRVLADRPESPARFLVLGSALPELVHGAYETLAGRASHVSMDGFDLDEAGPENARRLWLRGGLPKSYLAEDEAASFDWRRQFIQSHLERDFPQLGVRIPSATLRRFWIMLAHYHGRIWNASEFARSMGVKQDTALRYLDVLSGAFLVRALPPWFENVKKRLVKSPKVYVRDSGLLHALLGLKTEDSLLGHPGVGFSWEGFALEQTIRLAGIDRDVYFYQTHSGAELDCFFTINGGRYGFEFKFMDSPSTSKSMRSVMEDLKLNRLWVVYPGATRRPLDDRIELLPVSHLPQAVSEIREA